MDTINDIELADESTYPDEPVLRNVLGSTYDSYCALLDLFDRHHLKSVWRYYQDGKAWLCKVRKGKKTIVWMSAWKGYMQATLYVPERLIEEVYALPISEETKRRIKNTGNVGKSRPCIFEIRNFQVLEDLESILLFKMISK